MMTTSPAQRAVRAKMVADRQRARTEGMAAAREWRDFHRAAGTIWGIPPQPPAPICAGCGRPMK